MSCMHYFWHYLLVTISHSASGVLGAEQLILSHVYNDVYFVMFLENRALSSEDIKISRE